MGHLLLTYYPYRPINNIKANQEFSPDFVQFRDLVAERDDQLLLCPLAHVGRADGVHIGSASARLPLARGPCGLANRLGPRG